MKKAGFSSDAGMEEWLRAAGELAYEYDADSGHISWMGDAKAVLGDINRHLLSQIQDFNSIINAQDLPAKLQAQTFADAQVLTGPRSYECEYRLRLAEGDQLWVHDRGAVFFNPDKQSQVFRGFLRMIGAQRDDKKTLERLAFYDELTGFHNRSSVRQLLSRALRASELANTEGCFIAVGIDRLSLFNEAFDSNVADEVIRRVAERLDSLTGTSASLGRIAGDVFGIVLPDTNEHAVAALATKILSSLCTTPLDTAAGPLRVSVSLGGTTFPRDSREATDIITKAESALQAAKKQGRGCFLPYALSEVQREEYRGWLRTGDNFLLALDGNRLALAFQPVVDAQSGKTAFHECLVRMIGSNGSIMDAGEFIPAVERLGLARLVDQYTAKMVVEELVAFPDLQLSVNVSAWTLTDPCWLRRLISLLRRNPDVGKRLIVEITETMAMRDLDKARIFVKTLQDLGCRVALDDFGVGNTSFSQIKRLGVDIIKIDKSFVRNIGEDEESHLFIRALQGLADGFKLQTVGEGAETMEEVKFLRDDGVTFVQGYAYGFPSIERIWLPKGHSRRLPDYGFKFSDLRPVVDGPSSLN